MVFNFNPETILSLFGEDLPAGVEVILPNLLRDWRPAPHPPVILSAECPHLATEFLPYTVGRGITPPVQSVHLLNEGVQAPVTSQVVQARCQT